METCKTILTLLILVYPRVVHTWGVILWVLVQGQPILYGKEDVEVALSMKYRLMQKTIIP